MSGRDVRRVAARASTSGHHEKQQQVTRLVLAALSQGVQEIYMAREPFRICERAVENLAEREQVTLLKIPLRHSATDTETMMAAMWEAGCRVFIVLGGDGTSRIVARQYPEATLLPLSTGTNNVFPVFCEASIAGAAAGLVASGKLDADEHCRRCKQIHIAANNKSDIALIDAVLLRNDYIGSLLPFDADNIDTVILARAEPASVGVSPIGGYVMPCYFDDDFGVLAETRGECIKHHLRVPISPGLYNPIALTEVRQVQLGETVAVTGPGILAFDGDRSIELAEDESATLHVERDGPRVIHPASIMEIAAQSGLLRVE